MSLVGPVAGGSGLQLAGKRTSGLDVRTQNVTAVTAVANIVKTSLGPVGLDKVALHGWMLHLIINRHCMSAGHHHDNTLDAFGSTLVLADVGG